MGSSRPQPRKLAAKLRLIRMRLNLTQEQMADVVKHKRSPVYPGHISEFENGRREPSLLVLLKYARAANLTADSLIDDEVQLGD
jgi:transcriptional regulator with XRE-family HTH domain